MTTVIITQAAPTGESSVPAVGIPDTFIKFPAICCAIRFDNCEYPSCFGCKGAYQLCCVEGQRHYCKFPEKNSDGVCFVMSSGKEDLTAPELRCKIYEQCLCIEWVCGIPLEESLLSTGDMLRTINYARNMSSLNVIPYNAMCCAIQSCYCDTPACLAVYGKETLCCMESTSLSCKPLCCADAVKDNERSCCLLNSSNVVCYNTFRGCYKSLGHTCCIDTRVAIPCDNEVPCMYTMFPFCVCCVKGMCKCGCCATIADLTDQPDKTLGQANAQQQTVIVVQSAPAAPPAQVVYSSVETSSAPVSYDKAQT